MDEYPIQAGLFSRLRNRLSQVDQRTLLNGFLIFLILIGLAASVYLAMQRQIFRSGASQNGSAVVVDQNGKEIEQKEGDATVVETQQIRLRIEFPTEWNSQGFLPINSAYAQSNIVNCAASDGFRYENGIKTHECFGYNPDGNPPNLPGTNDRICQTYDLYKGVNNYSYSSCRPLTSVVPTSTPIPTQPPAQQNCPGQCASPKDQTSAVTINGSTCTSYLGNSAYDTNCRSKNTGYDWCYTSCAQPTAVPTRPPPPTGGPTATPAQAQGCGTKWEGKQTLCTAEDNRSGCTYLDAWSRSSSNNVCPASTPFCWACPESAFDAPAQPTARPPQTTTAPAAGGPQAPAPTATPVPEQIKWIRVSLSKANVESGNCWNEENQTGTGNKDQTQHCMEFSTSILVQRGNMINWELPKEAGTYPIYIGFVSDKGNLKLGPQVKVTYRPNQAISAGGPAAPAKPTGKECTSDVKPNGDVARFCVNGENRDQSKNVCSGGQLNVGYNCPPNFQYCLIGNDVICSPQAIDDIEGKPIANKGRCPGTCVDSQTLDKDGRTCSGKTWSTLYSCPDPKKFLCVTEPNCVFPGPSEK